MVGASVVVRVCMGRHVVHDNGRVGRNELTAVVRFEGWLYLWRCRVPEASPAGLQSEAEALPIWFPSLPTLRKSMTATLCIRPLSSADLSKSAPRIDL